jgi:membrane protease YdiL (CAAX protease family)
MEVGVRKAIFLFLVLFITWQVLYYIDLMINGLDWLLAYLVVLAVAICFYLLDKQKASDLGLMRPRLWRRYVIIAFIFAVVYVLYWAVLGARIFSTGPTTIIQHGPFTIPYTALETLVVGLVEETDFRGYILRNLKKVYSSTKAIAYSSLLNGLYYISLVYMFGMSLVDIFTYWTIFVPVAFVAGLFLGHFYVNAEQTTIGCITYHSFSMFLQTLVPYGLAIPFFYSHLFNESVYIVIFPLLVLLTRRGWLGASG